MIHELNLSCHLKGRSEMFSKCDRGMSFVQVAVSDWPIASQIGRRPTPTLSFPSLEVQIPYFHHHQFSSKSSTYTPIITFSCFRLSLNYRVIVATQTIRSNTMSSQSAAAASHDELNHSSLFKMKGRIALVTGGGSGIGLMATQALAVNGAKV